MKMSNEDQNRISALLNDVIYLNSMLFILIVLDIILNSILDFIITDMEYERSPGAL